MIYPKDKPNEFERVLVWWGEWCIARIVESESGRPTDDGFEWKEISGPTFSHREFPRWEWLPPDVTEEGKAWTHLRR